MYGNGIGTLKVVQSFGPPGSESSSRELWSLTGESSNNWHQGQITVSSNTIFRVRIPYSSFKIAQQAADVR